MNQNMYIIISFIYISRHFTLMSNNFYFKYIHTSKIKTEINNSVKITNCTNILKM